jgi:hypothetical protein
MLPLETILEAFSTNHEKEYLKMMQKIKWSQIKKKMMFS